MSQPQVSIIIPVWNGKEYLAACLNALLGQAGVTFEVIAVDNASQDGSAELIAEQYGQHVRLLRRPSNGGFSTACNQGAAAAEGAFLVFVNQDVVAYQDWLTELVAPLARPEIGVVGSKLLFPDGRLQHAGGFMPYPLALAGHWGHGEVDHGQYQLAWDVDFVTGASLAVRRDAWEQVGGFDAGFFPGYFEDSDLCLRLRQAGYRIFYQPKSVAVHHESGTIGQASLNHYTFFHRNRLRYIAKNYTPAQFCQDYLPAEKTWLAEVSWQRDLAGLYYAYQMALLLLPPFWKGTPDALAEALYGLRGLATQARERLAKWNEPLSRWTGMSAGSSPYLARLEEQRELSERPFPEAEGFIERFQKWSREREYQNAAQWEIRGLIEQQNGFNEALLRNLLQTQMRLEILETEMAEMLRSLAFTAQEGPAGSDKMAKWMRGGLKHGASRKTRRDA